MKVLQPKDSGYAKALASLKRCALPDPELEKTVAAILKDVRKNGDAALVRLTAKFGGPNLRPQDLYVSSAEMADAVADVPRGVHEAIQISRKNVLAFARRGLRKSWYRKNAQGAMVGERFDPFGRVGIYIPGGSAPLVSSAIMTCTLAMAAGVPEIVAVTPPGKQGTIPAPLLAALHACGATEVHRVGGAQAIAALAFGTRSIAPVQKIFGPGNAYVVEAKRQVFGAVAIDLLPGPSEVLVIADASANPEWVAADLLAQCEHGHGSQGILVSPSTRLVTAVKSAITKQVKLSGRPKELAEALKNTTLIVVRTLADAVNIANDYAAEHVSIATADPGPVALSLNSSGAIFLGGMSPVVAGDFLAGPSHELPTGGAGHSFAGLTADQFQRRTSMVMYDRDSLEKSLPTIRALAGVEGLDAHARSAAIRIE